MHVDHQVFVIGLICQAENEQIFVKNQFIQKKTHN